MNRLKTAGIVAVSLGTSACVPTVREAFMKDNLDRAVFDLSCPKEKIELVGLSRKLDDYMSWVGTSVGVNGCGKKMVYTGRATCRMGRGLH